MKRCLIFLLTVPFALASCGQLSQYAMEQTFVDGIYYRPQPVVTLLTEEDFKQRASENIIADSLRIHRKLQQEQDSKDYSYDRYNPYLYGYGFGSWYWDGPSWYGSYYYSPWRWRSYAWNSWYDRWYDPYWYNPYWYDPYWGHSWSFYSDYYYWDRPYNPYRPGGGGSVKPGDDTQKQFYRGSNHRRAIPGVQGVAPSSTRVPTDLRGNVRSSSGANHRRTIGLGESRQAAGSYSEGRPSRNSYDHKASSVRIPSSGSSYSGSSSSSSGHSYSSGSSGSYSGSSHSSSSSSYSGGGSHSGGSSGGGGRR